jgi:hypothetical protein
VRVLIFAVIVAACSDGAPVSRDAAGDAPPDARFCRPNGNSCAQLPQPLEGTWSLAATHAVYRGSGPGLGMFSMQLTFTPTSDAGCYDGVATGVPSTAGPNWPDPTGVWRTDGESASFNTLKNGSLPVSWTYCTRFSDGMVQFQGMSYYTLVEIVESVTGIVTKQ